jgi:glyoxylase-like metal-dependent hydrolase (beta-lactamase superfamily II)
LRAEERHHGTGSAVVRRLTIGDVAVALVYDGSIRITPEVIFPVDRRSEWPSLDLDNVGEFLCPVSCLLVWSSAGLALVDAGNGRLTSKKFTGGGELVENLRASAIDPESVDIVVMTHAHGDHFGGVTTRVDGDLEPAFPRARHFISRQEWEHVRAGWGHTPHLAETLFPLERQGLLVPVEMDAQIAPELCLQPAYGHTPGHCAVQVVGNGAGLLFLGDAVHHLVEVANPDLVSTGDYDRLAVPATRRRLLDLALAQNLIVIASHFDFPNAYRLSRSGTGYTTQPV